MTNFPKKLYIKRVDDRDEHYWVAAEDWADLAEADETTIDAAVYDLQEVGKLAVKKEFTPAAPAKLRRVK